MSTKDLKQLERNIFISYHQDGLVDIFVGLVMLTFSLGMLWGFAAFSGAIVVLGTPIWMLMKRKITIPRIGFVRFSNKRTKPLAAFLVIGLLVLFFFFVLGFFSASVAESGFFNLIEQHYMIMIAMIFAIPFFFLGSFLGIPRMYVYCVATIMLVTLGSISQMTDWLPLLSAGTLVFTWGLITMIRFIKNNPVINTEFGNGE
ncbi:MAG: hypothetical protein JEZ06_22675 [Anaerolineaceae bacterium]|nr:hypothetical protein [Anaerolineaceae bacterium]